MDFLAAATVLQAIVTVLLLVKVLKQRVRIFGLQQLRDSYKERYEMLLSGPKLSAAERSVAMAPENLPRQLRPEGLYDYMKAIEGGLNDGLDEVRSLLYQLIEYTRLEIVRLPAVPAQPAKVILQLREEVIQE